MKFQLKLHLRIKSQNSEDVKTHCNIIKNPFHFAKSRWMNKQFCDMVIVSVTIFGNNIIE